eukprot:1157298-Pelagomonas_calceolata.AAC.14
MACNLVLCAATTKLPTVPQHQEARPAGQAPRGTNNNHVPRHQEAHPADVGGSARLCNTILEGLHQESWHYSAQVYSLICVAVHAGNALMLPQKTAHNLSPTMLMVLQMMLTVQMAGWQDNARPVTNDAHGADGGMAGQYMTWHK